MATLTIRQLDELTHARLRDRAASHGRSVEAEVRTILAAAVGRPDQNLLLSLRVDFAGSRVALELPERSDQPRSADLT
ncbi:MAG: toxin-antitoxin system antitoxin subunit [Nocardioides sp.]